MSQDRRRPGWETEKILGAIAEVREQQIGLDGRLDVLNTRLFGNPEGDAGDEGRLVIAERRVNSHATRIASLESQKIDTHEPRLRELEKFRWYVGGLLAALAGAWAYVWKKMGG